MSKPSKSLHRTPEMKAPRVQMTYDVEVGDSVETRELPFVVGVLADVAGDSAADKRRLKERPFVAIGIDTFDDVMKSVAPRVLLEVPNLIEGGDSSFTVDLSFRAMADFRPEAVLAQIEPLRALLEARTRLAVLRASVLGERMP